MTHKLTQLVGGSAQGEEKEFNKAVRILFKTQDQRNLTQEGLDACKTLCLKPESLYLR